MQVSFPVGKANVSVAERSITKRVPFASHPMGAGIIAICENVTALFAESSRQWP